MKILLTIILAFAYLSTKAQTAKIQLIEDGYYQLDTLSNKIILDDPDRNLKISIVSYQSNYFLSEYKGKKIYISYTQIKQDRNYSSFLDKYQKAAQDALMPEEEKNDIRAYGKYLGSMFYLKQLCVGMTKGMVEKCMGKPDTNASTESTYYNADLWVYKMNDKSYKYIYFFNNKVHSIEEVHL